MAQLNNLFSPTKIGQLELKNRIVMLCGNASGGGRQLIPHFAERAAGGAAMLIVGGLLPWELGEAKTMYLSRKDMTEEEKREVREAGWGLYSDELIPWLSKFTKAIHDNGAKACAQILIAYEWKRNWKTDKKAPVEIIGPSDTLSGSRQGNMRPLAVEEIHQIVEEYGDAARRARDAGFDCVEIHAGMGYMINRFLSPRSNKRTDDYGGSIEKRGRILIEVVQSIHKKAGADYPVIVRLSADDFMPEGNMLEHTKPLSALLEKAGAACIDVEAGWHECAVPMIHQWTPPGSFVYLAEEIKKAVSIPVMCGYRINDPVLANTIVAEGRSDLIGMCRQLIADPQFPNKAMAGKYDEIRHCIACCRCLDCTRTGLRPGCSVNPRVAREADFPIGKAAKSKKVLVIGGGPAGMQAAITASQRGHKVTLCDKGRRLGGSMLLAGVLNEELPRFIKTIEGELRREPIEVKLNTEVDLAFVQAMKPDAVVVALGGVPQEPPIPGVKGDNVLSGHDMVEAMIHPPSKGGFGQKLMWRLSSPVMLWGYWPGFIRWGLRFGFPFGKKVVIIGGGFAGCETADTLGEKGKQVTVVEQGPRMGYDIGVSSRWVVLKRLTEFGVETEKNAKVMEITDKGVKIAVDGKEKILEADTVALALPLTPNSKLAEEIQKKGFAVQNVGDCATPGRIMEALQAGYRTAYEV